MDLYSGTDSDVTSFVTPVMNDNLGPVASQYMAMYTGALNKTQVAEVRFMNDVAYLNMEQNIYNGKGYQTFFQPLATAATSYVDATLIGGASNGM